MLKQKKAGHGERVFLRRFNGPREEIYEDILLLEKEGNHPNSSAAVKLKSPGDAWRCAEKKKVFRCPW